MSMPRLLKASRTAAILTKGELLETPIHVIGYPSLCRYLRYQRLNAIDSSLHRRFGALTCLNTYRIPINFEEVAHRFSRCLKLSIELMESRWIRLSRVTIDVEAQTVEIDGVETHLIVRQS